MPVAAVDATTEEIIRINEIPNATQLTRSRDRPVVLFE